MWSIADEVLTQRATDVSWNNGLERGSYFVNGNVFPIQKSDRIRERDMVDHDIGKG